ncbi:MAG: ExbD/TolR family protein [Verrucomicrobiota bacterium]
MKLRKTIEPLQGPVDAAPMVDIVLLLLIFFLITSSFVFQAGIKVELPAGAGAGGANSRHIIALSQNPPMIFFNDQIATLESLEKQFKLIARGEPNATLVLKADKDVSHGTVVQVMNLAIQSGLSIVIATQPVENKPVETK